MTQNMAKQQLIFHRPLLFALLILPLFFLRFTLTAFAGWQDSFIISQTLTHPVPNSS